VPPVRALALEFPDDPMTLSNNTGSAFQFMSGEWFLVAPVFVTFQRGNGPDFVQQKWL
jgi:alpha-glucosidase (family GH31 glycosyl hydrolase)